MPDLEMDKKYLSESEVPTQYVPNHTVDSTCIRWAIKTLDDAMPYPYSKLDGIEAVSFEFIIQRAAEMIRLAVSANQDLARRIGELERRLASLDSTRKCACPPENQYEQLTDIARQNRMKIRR